MILVALMAVPVTVMGQAADQSPIEIPFVKFVLLKEAGLTVADVQRVEVNEAFASVPLTVAKALDIPHEKLNVNGGAIALGHPLAASGGRVLAWV